MERMRLRIDLRRVLRILLEHRTELFDDLLGCNGVESDGLSARKRKIDVLRARRSEVVVNRRAALCFFANTFAHHVRSEVSADRNQDDDRRKSKGE